MTLKIFSENRKAGFDHDLLEKFEAGLVLRGTEVKSIRLGQAQLSGSYVLPRVDGFYLVGCHVPAYQPKNAPPDYRPERERKLLLRKKEIDLLTGRSSQKGLTFVPLKLYTNGGQIKLQFALARPLKKKNKREQLRRKEAEREMRGAY